MPKEGRKNRRERQRGKGDGGKRQRKYRLLAALCLAPSATLDKTKLNPERVNGSSQRNNKKIQKLPANTPEPRDREKDERKSAARALKPHARYMRIRRNDKSMRMQRDDDRERDSDVPCKKRRQG